MKAVWEYIKKENHIQILKGYTDSESPIVPAQIEGLPVTEIGPYAFSASEIPRRFRVEAAQVCRYEETEQFFSGETEEIPERIAGERLKEIFLPEAVETIGDYAFYGCSALQKIAFSDGLKRIGSGAFMGCSAVRAFVFSKTGENDGSLFQMLSEVRYAVEVEIQEKTGTSFLVFPEYYELSVENTPARIFEVHFQGTGYRYRQCFQNGKLDYAGYDNLFSLAVSQEPAEVLAKLAYSRLRSPGSLSEEARKQYIGYFSSHVKAAGSVLLQEDNLEAIKLIAKAGGFDGEAEEPNALKRAALKAERKPVADGAGDFYMAFLGEDSFGKQEESALPDGFGKEEAGRNALDVMLELAGRMGRTECLSCLLDYHYRKNGSGKGKKKKSFDL